METYRDQNQNSRKQDPKYSCFVCTRMCFVQAWFHGNSRSLVAGCGRLGVLCCCEVDKHLPGQHPLVTGWFGLPCCSLCAGTRELREFLNMVPTRSMERVYVCSMWCMHTRLLDLHAHFFFVLRPWVFAV